MPVCPIDYGRYGHQEMIEIFQEEYRHALWLKIEAAVSSAQSELDIIPKDAAEDIKKTAVPETVTLERTMEIEAETRHDVAALFEAIAEKCEGPGSRWVHFGLTSNDIKDTALSLQLKAAFEVILSVIENLVRVLADRAKENVDLIAVGRSHGQHAVPITYGLRFAVWLDEVMRHQERLMEAYSRCKVGKVAGATGSHAAMGTIGLDVQERVLSELGLKVPIATTQIVQRDRHAEAVLVLANMASSMDKIATDLRNLQRTELAETYEPFAKGKQVGSSAMPHKRNPVTCEKISGIARYIRSLVGPALENVISWEERDISHSSTERFVIPQAFVLTDYIVREMTRVMRGLTINKDAVKKNLSLVGELVLSEYLVTVLTKAGLERPKAHAKLRELSVLSSKEGKGLFEVTRSDPDLMPLLKDINLDIEEYYDSIREVSKVIVDKAVNKATESLSSATE